MVFAAGTKCLWSDEPKSFRHSLFDGESINGWIVENDCEADVVDGCLRLKSGKGWLRHESRLRDFELHFEWKPLKESKYDAGVAFRSQKGKPFPLTDYEISLREGDEGRVPNSAALTNRRLMKPAGEWNVFDLRVIRDTASLKINGQDAWNAGGLKATDGWIGFRFDVPNGGQFLFKNIEVVELGYESLFNGVDITGWEGAGGNADECWSVSNGLLTCSGKKGPWLRSSREYGDFDLRLDYRVSKGGNSGVYVRVPKDGNHHRDNDTQPAAGFEVQVLDDTAPEHANLKDYQYSASIYDFVGANPRNSRPLREWNSLEINCHGQHITTWHNGMCVTNVTADELPLLNLRSITGFLGLQNHSTVVDFRSIRIGSAIDVPVGAAAKEQPSTEPSQ